MTVSIYRDYWQSQYKRVLQHRKELWLYLEKYNLSHELFIKRPKEHLWAIDEIFRHMLASEVVYVHQKFDPSASPKDFGVGAQWVGDYDIKLNELPHFTQNEIKNLSSAIEDKTQLFLEKSQEESFHRKVKAPWGEEMEFTELLEAFYIHEAHHRGQIHYLLNLLGNPQGIQRKKLRR